MARLTVTIDFQNENDDELAEWIKRNRLDRDSLDDLDAIVDVDLSDVDNDELAAEYLSRFLADPADEDTVSRAYRYLGEGDIAAAMEELHAAFPDLRTPHDERRMADLLSRPVKGGANG